MKRLFLEIVVLVLVAALLYRWSTRPVPPPTAAPPAAAKTFSKRVPRKRLVDSTWSAKLEKRARASARAWAVCFAGAQLPQGRARISIDWDGSSHLIRLRVVPTVSDTVESCLADEVRSWDLAAPPSLRPYSFEQEIVVGADAAAKLPKF